MLPEDRRAFIQRIYLMEWPNDWFVPRDFPINMRDATLFTYETGIHEKILLHRRGYQLRLAENRATWNRTKTGNQISFPMEPHLREVATRLLTHLPPDHCTRPFTCPSQFVVPLTRAFQRMAAKAQFTGIGSRTLRHTSIRRAFERGANRPEVLKLYFGRGSGDIADRYASLTAPTEYERKMLAGEFPPDWGPTRAGYGPAIPPA
jgi:hypothetical protein